MKKKMVTLSIVAALTAAFTMTAFAAEWKQDTTGWWWQNDDGTYPINSWKWIDGNSDGISECYYFDQNGYMMVNTEIEGSAVNGDGAWIVNGVVQTQIVAQQSVNNSQSDILGYEAERLEKAKEALREAGMISFYEDNFTERKDALYNYLQVLGYDTSLLKFTKYSHSYGDGVSGGNDPLWDLITANNQEVFDLMSDYVSPGYTWAKDEDGEFYEVRIMVYGLEDEGDDGYATNLINAIESQLF